MNNARMGVALWIRERQGGWWVAALSLAFAAALFWLVLYPRQANELRRLENAQAVPARIPVAKSARIGSDEALRAFESRLADSEQRVLLQQRLWADSASLGLHLAQADYKQELDPKGQFMRLRIRAPVTGPYPAVKTLLFGLMSTFPSLALERVEFKRENAAAEVQATLHLILFTRP